MGPTLARHYDQFVREQIAGDSLGADVATGFLVCVAYDDVKSPDIVLTLNQRQDELATMINTIGTSMLGLTLGCARCHNHRFDPITQEDYYSLLALLAGVRHGERSVQMESRAEGTPLVAGMAYAGRFENPSATHLLYRGDPLQQREEVSPGSIEALEGFRLPADTAEQQRRQRRTQFAQRRAGLPRFRSACES